MLLSRGDLVDQSHVITYRDAVGPRIRIGDLVHRPNQIRSTKTRLGQHWGNTRTKSHRYLPQTSNDEKSRKSRNITGKQQ